MFASWQESYDKPRQCVEKQKHYSANKSLYTQGYGLPSGHVWLWELDCKEGGAMNNWWLQTMVLEKTPESLLDSKIKPVNLKGNQPWLLVGRTNADAQKPVFWSSDVYCWLIEKVPDAGKDWGQKEKRVSEDEMAGWHHRCNRHELGQTSGDGEGQRGLACCKDHSRYLGSQRIGLDWATEQWQSVTSKSQVLATLMGRMLHRVWIVAGKYHWQSTQPLSIILKCWFTQYSPSVRRRQWHPTPVLLPGKSHGWRSLVGCSPWGR